MCGSATATARSRGRSPGLVPATVAWEYADGPANDAQPRDVEVDRVVARLFAERAKQEAVQLNREGRYEDARRSSAPSGTASAAYAAATGNGTPCRRSFSEEQLHYAAPMPEMPARPPYIESSDRFLDAHVGREVAQGLTSAGAHGDYPADLQWAGSFNAWRPGRLRAPRKPRTL